MHSEKREVGRLTKVSGNFRGLDRVNQMRKCSEPEQTGGHCRQQMPNRPGGRGLSGQAVDKGCSGQTVGRLWAESAVGSCGQSLLVSQVEQR